MAVIKLTGLQNVMNSFI